MNDQGPIIPVFQPTDTGLAGALQFVAFLKEQAYRPAVIHPPGFPQHTRLVCKVSGETELLEVPPEPMNVRLGTPDAFRRFAEFHSGPGSEVFYNESRLTLILDGSTRRDLAHCDLQLTPQMGGLLQGGLCQWKSQSDFLRMLRIDMHGCIPPDSSLISAVRHLKWEKYETAIGTVGHGSESLGKTVTANVTSDRSVLPEEVSLHMQVWHNFDQFGSLRCAVEVDVANQKLRLTPMPGAMQRLFSMALLAMGEYLSSSELMPTCHHGSV